MWIFSCSFSVTRSFSPIPPPPYFCCVNRNSGFAFSFWSHVFEVASKDVSFATHTVSDRFRFGMRTEEQCGEEKGVGKWSWWCRRRGLWGIRCAGVELGLDDGSAHYLACTSSSHVTRLEVQDGSFRGSALKHTRQWYDGWRKLSLFSFNYSLISSYQIDTKRRVPVK